MELTGLLQGFSNKAVTIVVQPQRYNHIGRGLYYSILDNLVTSWISESSLLQVPANLLTTFGLFCLELDWAKYGYMSVSNFIPQNSSKKSEKFLHRLPAPCTSEKMPMYLKVMSTP
mgnify:CR=1 FL=1